MWKGPHPECGQHHPMAWSSGLNKMGTKRKLSGCQHPSLPASCSNQTQASNLMLPLVRLPHRRGSRCFKSEKSTWCSVTERRKLQEPSHRWASARPPATTVSPHFCAFLEKAPSWGQSRSVVARDGVLGRSYHRRTGCICINGGGDGYVILSIYQNSTTVCYRGCVLLRCLGEGVNAVSNSPLLSWLVDFSCPERFGQPWRTRALHRHTLHFILKCY